MTGPCPVPDGASSPTTATVAATRSPGATRRALARAQAGTDAAGVAADTRRLLGQIARHDRSGVLAGVRAAQDP